MSFKFKELIKSLLLSSILCLTIIAVGFGQETTGSIEITIKDATGAVIPNASVSVVNSDSSNTTAFKRVITTNEDGYQRILQVPPGVYTLTVAPTNGFGVKTLENIQVVLGKSTPVLIELGGQVGAVVDVTAEGAAIDTTDSKIQTNITAQTAELLPKGTNFSSLLKVSPATRPELGGFQVDGSSGSENTFIIDGQEVTNARTGVLNSNSNVPFSLVQEVQIKSSGFEAEYGGATGGVINVVTKGGSSEYHGSAEIAFSPSKLQALASPTQYLNANQ
ncbi:MAG TPA: TonB-dependent receptor [Pyrinomonadaceae bacterium]|nr:TonB-dependent receptor [Pyrinomonadaceae bacterium]